MMNEHLLFTVGLTLIMAGFITVFLAVLLLLLKTLREKGRVKGAGVVMIGPIPIVFGTDKKSIKIVLSLSIALVVLVVILMMFYYRRF